MIGKLKEKRQSWLSNPDDYWYYEYDVLAFLKEQEKDETRRWLKHCDSCIHKQIIEKKFKERVEQLKKDIEMGWCQSKGYCNGECYQEEPCDIERILKLVDEVFCLGAK